MKRTSRFGRGLAIALMGVALGRSTWEKRRGVKRLSGIRPEDGIVPYRFAVTILIFGASFVGCGGSPQQCSTSLTFAEAQTRPSCTSTVSEVIRSYCDTSCQKLLECGFVLDPSVQQPLCEDDVLDRSPEEGRSLRDIADLTSYIGGVNCDGVRFCARSLRCDLTNCGGI